MVLGALFFESMVLGATFIESMLLGEFIHCFDGNLLFLQKKINENENEKRKCTHFEKKKKCMKN